MTAQSQTATEHPTATELPDPPADAGDRPEGIRHGHALPLRPKLIGR